MSDLCMNDWQRAESTALCMCLYRCQGAIEWSYGVVALASGWCSGMLVLNVLLDWLLKSFAAFYGRKLGGKCVLFFGVLHVCACKCGTGVSGHARKAAQRLQMVCTR